MNWLQKTSDNDLFDEIFNTPSRQIVKKDPPNQEQVTWTLYHGFGDINKLQREGDHYILLPQSRFEGVSWFTPDLEQAKWRGSYLITYPLEVIKHRERVHYDDGSFYDDIPDEIKSMCSPTENCRFHGGTELPEGWFFSYKVEKHIVRAIPLEITGDMLTKQNTS